MDWITGSNTHIDIMLNGLAGRQEAETKADDNSGNKIKLPVFLDGETISGIVNITLRNNKKLEHAGIKIEFVGDIQVYFDKNNSYDFVSVVKQLARPGELVKSTSFKFEFPNAEKPFESYSGANVRLRYVVRVTIMRKYKVSPTKECPILVHALHYFPEKIPQTLKMEVGIEDALHIEFEFNKPRYHLKDVIVGKIYFILVRLKIRVMELQLLKKEVTGQGTTRAEDEETVVKYEIMDGSPVRGETIPIRLFLIALGLTPTFREVAKKFSVSYFINLVLVDEDDRRYFKQQEITLYRKSDKTSLKLMGGNAGGANASSVKNGGGADTEEQLTRSNGIAFPTSSHAAHLLSSDSANNLPTFTSKDAYPTMYNNPASHPPTADSNTTPSVVPVPEGEDAKRSSSVNSSSSSRVPVSTIPVS